MKKYFIGILFILSSIFIVNNNQTSIPIKNKIKTIDEKKILVTKKIVNSNQVKDLELDSIKIISHISQIDKKKKLVLANDLSFLSNNEISELLQSDEISVKRKKAVISLLFERATEESLKVLFDNIENLYDDALIEYIQNSLIELADNIVNLGKEDEMQFLLADAYMQYKEDDRFNKSLITAISKMENNDALVLLEKEFINDETSDDIKVTILDSMQNFKNDEYVSQLTINLTTDNNELISLSTQALASIGNEDSVTALLNWSSDFEDEDNIDIVGETFQLLVKKHPELKEDILDELEIYSFDSDSVKDELVEILI